MSLLSLTLYNSVKSLKFNVSTSIYITRSTFGSKDGNAIL